MKLVELRKENIKEFKKLMQDAFQLMKNILILIDYKIVTKKMMECLDLKK